MKGGESTGEFIGQLSGCSGRAKTGMLKFPEQSSRDNSVVAGNALDANSHTKPGWVYKLVPRRYR